MFHPLRLDNQTLAYPGEQGDSRVDDAECEFVPVLDFARGEGEGGVVDQFERVFMYPCLSVLCGCSASGGVEV